MRPYSVIDNTGLKQIVKVLVSPLYLPGRNECKLQLFRNYDGALLTLGTFIFVTYFLIDNMPVFEGHQYVCIVIVSTLACQHERLAVLAWL